MSKTKSYMRIRESDGFEPETLQGQNVPEMRDSVGIPSHDGAIPQTPEGIVSGNFDALNPSGSYQIDFETGNFGTLLTLPETIRAKIEAIHRTILPLVEVALIELLESSTSYRRTSGQFVPSFGQDGNTTIAFDLTYTTPDWVASDVDMSDIQHDSTYVLNKVRPAGASITKCEIDCTKGTLRIQGSI